MDKKKLLVCVSVWMRVWLSYKEHRGKQLTGWSMDSAAPCHNQNKWLAEAKKWQFYLIHHKTQEKRVHNCDNTFCTSFFFTGILFAFHPTVHIVAQIAFTLLSVVFKVWCVMLESCKVGLPYTWTFSSTDARWDWNLGNSEANSRTWTLCHAPQTIPEQFLQRGGGILSCWKMPLPSGNTTGMKGRTWFRWVVCFNITS